MFDQLNQYGLPAKYGILGFLGGIVGASISDLLGFGSGLSLYVTTPIAAGIGGLVGGWLRQRRGEQS